MDRTILLFGALTAMATVVSQAGLAQTAAVPNPQTTISNTTWKFNFGTGKPNKGYLAVAPDTLYAPERGYGFEPGTQVAADGTSVSSDKPFLFSAAVPEGNYRVTVILGDKNGASNTTVKAETRRLMLENVQTTAGQPQTRAFLVNIRTPRLPDGGAVRINDREKGPPIIPHWDDKLTLEFNGLRPSLTSLEIERVEDVPTIFLAGDSTVTDQRNEPYAAWGQMLPRFFKPSIAVANYAESGLTLGSFRAQKRLAKVLATLKNGDYVFIQFGHNDQKDKGEDAGPFKSYKTNLKDYVAQIRGRGGIPVIVTPMERRRWSDGKPQPTLSDYAEAARQVGQEEVVSVIDLNAMSLKFYAALGPDNSAKAFAIYPVGSFPGQKEALKDNTHFNNYGAYELARCIVTGIREKVSALVPALAVDATPFDPATPDSFDKFPVPPSPYKVSEKPAGS